jgi:putative transposase
VANKYDGSKKRGPGRPPQPRKIVQLLIKMAEENPRWGYTRLRGALRNVGYDVGRNTIKRILKGQGIEPAPVRGKSMSWMTFIKAHLGAIAAADFFTVEVASLAGLVRYHVFFLIDIASRQVEITGITSRPGGSWMEQIARNLLDVEDGFLLGKRYLLLDRDPLYTKEFHAALKRGGRSVALLPPRSPDLNAFAERFVLSIKSECLDRIVPLGERHLRRAVSEFVAHYHRERTHQGLENRLIESAPEPANMNGRIVRRERLGGLLNFYGRAVA